MNNLSRETEIAEQQARLKAPREAHQAHQDAILAEEVAVDAIVEQRIKANLTAGLTMPQVREVARRQLHFDTHGKPAMDAQRNLARADVQRHAAAVGHVVTHGRLLSVD